jgi:hypothetical protein
MRLPFLLSLAAVAMLGTHPCLATGANLAGYGTLTCSEASALIDRPEYRVALTGWAMGFMSGANMAMMSAGKGYRDLEHIDPDGVLQSVRTFCASNPTVPVSSGVEKFFAGRPALP